MGNPFSKDGIVTKVVESLPGGGFITAPIHAAAGNAVHAAQAAIAGFGTLAATVTTGPVGGIIAGAGTAGLSAVFDEVGLNDDKKVEAVQAASTGNYNHAAEVLLQAGSDKIADNSRQLSAESGGRRCLKSIHGTFLRAHDSEWKVDLVPNRREWENWYVEDWGGKVVFKAIHSPGRFLRAHPDGRVDLVDRPQAWETWKPFKNNDGSWSFLSLHGKWLSGRQDGSVCTVDNHDAWEHFWLEWW
jgi:hypothetical protein